SSHSTFAPGGMMFRQEANVSSAACGKGSRVHISYARGPREMQMIVVSATVATIATMFARRLVAYQSPNTIAVEQLTVSKRSCARSTSHECSIRVDETLRSGIAVVS